MTVYYTLTFALLVAEMVTQVVMLVPMPFAARKRIFHFMSESFIVAKLAYALKITFIFIAVLFVDALQRVLRVTAEADLAKQAGGHNAASETSHAAKKFYAQRNLYLTAFTLFLSPVVTRTYYVLLDNIHTTDEYAKLKIKFDQLSAKADQPTGAEAETIADLRTQLEIKSRDLEVLQKQIPSTSKKAY